MDFKDLSIPPVLYHYTSWDTFEKIVKNHTWRFSSINGTNDLSCKETPSLRKSDRGV